MALRRVNQREFRTAVKAQLEGLSIMAGKTPLPYETRIPEQRGPRKPSGKPLERAVVDDIQRLSRESEDFTLWRNVSGQIALANGQRIRYGVGPPGASDFIGFVSVTVTPSMVGQRVAVFCAVEAKSESGMPTEDQMKFIFRIRKAGGRAGIARSATDAKEIVS